MQIDKKRVILNCWGAYVFQEIFKPIIEENYRIWDIIVLISDALIPNYVLRELEHLYKRKKIESFHLYPSLEKQNRIFRITELTFQSIRAKYSKEDILQSLSPVKYQVFLTKNSFLVALKKHLSVEDFDLLSKPLIKYANKTFFKTNLYITRLLKSLRYQKIDLVGLMHDHGSINQYLVEYAKSRGIPSVNICPWAMPQVIRAYIELDSAIAREDFDSIPTQWPIRQLSPASKTEKKGIKQRVKYSIFLKGINLLFRQFNKAKTEFFREQLYSFLLRGRFSFTTQLNKVCFASGQSDYTICYDPSEIRALKEIVPSVKNTILAKHPSGNMCSCQDSNKPKRKLLVIFGSHLDYELEGEKFTRWVETIKRIIELARIDEVCLRLHPRSLPSIKWPQNIIKACQDPNCQITIMHAIEVSIAEIACDYVGVLGSPSAALRVARFACHNLFVIAITNCGEGERGDYYYMADQMWSLGKAEGIRFVSECGPPQKDDIIVPHLPFLSRPSISEILNELSA